MNLIEDRIHVIARYRIPYRLANRQGRSASNAVAMTKKIDGGVTEILQGWRAGLRPAENRAPKRRA